MSPPLGPTKSEKESKKKDVPVPEKAKWDKKAVDAFARPVTVPDPIIEKRKKSRKRKERDDVIDPEGSTTIPDLQVQKKKRKKEQGKGKEREKLTVSEPMPVEAIPVQADEVTKAQKQDKDGKGKERDEEKAAKKARKAQRKLEKVSGSGSTGLDRSIALSCNVPLSYALGINA
jgi:hypothetical protein